MAVSFMTVISFFFLALVVFFAIASFVYDSVWPPLRWPTFEQCADELLTWEKLNAIAMEEMAPPIVKDFVHFYKVSIYCLL